MIVFEFELSDFRKPDSGSTYTYAPYDERKIFTIRSATRAYDDMLAEVLDMARQHGLQYLSVRNYSRKTNDDLVLYYTRDYDIVADETGELKLVNEWARRGL